VFVNPAINPDNNRNVMANMNDDGWRPYIIFIKGMSDTEPLLARRLADPINAASDIETARALVAGLSLPGSSVLDPFIGRGAVGQATIAVGGGRKYTGVERDSGSYLFALETLGPSSAAGAGVTTTMTSRKQTVGLAKY
jgi:hypothetical protein